MASPSDVDAFLFIPFFIGISLLQLECILFLSLSVSLSLSIISVLHSSVKISFSFKTYLLLFSLRSRMVATHCSIFCTSKLWYRHLPKTCVHLTWFVLSITCPLYTPVEHMSSYSPGNCSVHSSP